MKKHKAMKVLTGAIATMGLGSAADAALTVELSATSGTGYTVSNGGKTVTFDSSVPASVVGTTVNFNVLATVTGAGPFGMQTAQGAVISDLTGGGDVIGDVGAFAPSATFNATGAAAGASQNLPGQFGTQAGLDRGSGPNGGVASDFVVGRASSMVAGASHTLGTISFTVTSVSDTGTTVLNWYPRKNTAGGNLNTAAVWDENTGAAGTNNPTNSTYAAGTGVSLVFQAAAVDNTVSLTSVGAAPAPTITITGSSTSYNGGFVDVTNSNTGTVGINAVAPVSGTPEMLVALDVEGYADTAALNAFIASLIKETGSYNVVASNIDGSTPGWLSSIPGAGTDWEVLLSFNPTGASPFNFSWAFAGTPGIVVDRVAAVPEPAGLGLLGLGALGLISRRRRAK